MESTWKTQLRKTKNTKPKHENHIESAKFLRNKAMTKSELSQSKITLRLARIFPTRHKEQRPNPFDKAQNHRRDGNKANQLKMMMKSCWRQGPQEDCQRAHEWTQARQTPFSKKKRWKAPGKIDTGNPKSMKLTLLGRQRTGPKLTYLRRGENKASQLKIHKENAN